MSLPARSGRREFITGTVAAAAWLTSANAVAPARAQGREAAGFRGTWRRYPIPAYPKGIGSGSKHTRWAYRSRTGDWYVNGGDYTQHGETPPALDSGSNNTWRVDLRANVWERLVGYWPREGEILPSHPDETTFVYDPQRDIFWHGGGFAWRPHSPGKSRENSPIPAEIQDRLVHGRWMSFDPNRRQWKDEGPVAKIVQGGRARFGHYDEGSDAVYIPYTDGSGNGIGRFHCGKRGWQSAVRLGPPEVRQMGTDYSLLDSRRRRLVFLRNADCALFAWEIESGRWSELSTEARPTRRKLNSYGLAYHVKLDLYALHGGREIETDSPTNDVWVIPAEGKSWQRLPLDGDGPGPRNTQTLLYEPQMDALISFGGTGGPSDRAYFSAHLVPA